MSYLKNNQISDFMKKPHKYLKEDNLFFIKKIRTVNKKKNEIE